MFCYSPRRSSDVGDQKAVGMDVASWPSNMQKQPPLRFQQWPTSLPPRWWNHNIVVLHPCLWEINKEIELKEDEGSDFLFCSNPSILLDYTKQQRIPNNKKMLATIGGRPGVTYDRKWRDFSYVVHANISTNSKRETLWINEMHNEPVFVSHFEGIKLVRVNKNKTKHPWPWIRAALTLDFHLSLFTKPIFQGN